MRKIYQLCLVALALLCLTACSKQCEAEMAMREYVTDVQKGDYKAFYEGINPNSARLKESKARDPHFCEHFIEKNKMEFEKRGGVKEYKVFRKTVTEVGDSVSAVLEYVVTYGNGTKEKNMQKMVKVGNKWYMDV